MDVEGKRSLGPKAEKDKTERATGLGIKYIEKWDQTESAEIPDRRYPKSPASLRGVGW